ncbi:STAS domain-containing protein [Streptomyces atacamensis]|uniref:STAS domain-containing protein n=1 Tax=Streptomyces atacamensis TaxID=531966 RepID=UPI00399CB51B
MTADLAFIVQSVHGPLAVAAVVGDVDYDTAPALRRGGQAVIDSGHQVLVLDLSGASQVDSSALSAVIALRRHARAAGGVLALAAVPGRLGRMLALTGVEMIVPVYSTVPQAVAALATPPASGAGKHGDGGERASGVGVSG